MDHWKIRIEFQAFAPGQATNSSGFFVKLPRNQEKKEVCYTPDVEIRYIILKWRFLSYPGLEIRKNGWLMLVLRNSWNLWSDLEFQAHPSYLCGQVPMVPESVVWFSHQHSWYSLTFRGLWASHSDNDLTLEPSTCFPAVLNSWPVFISTMKKLGLASWETLAISCQKYQNLIIIIIINSI